MHLARAKKFPDDCSAPGDPPVLTPGAWYVDRSPTHEYQENGARLRVLVIGTQTVRVEDEWGQTRVVNRLMFESQMRSEAPKPRRTPVK